MRNADVIIVGAGPGGLQLAHDLEQRGRSYVVLERSARAGSFFAKFPRHRTLISVNKIHTGFEDDELRMRFDWNSLLHDGHDEGCFFRDFSKDYFPQADAMVRYLDAYARRFVPAVEFECEVEQIRRTDDGVFLTRARDGRSFRSKAVVVATGLWEPFRPPIPGLELAESYTTFDLDPDRFENARVLIIGKGNSAFETADAMIHKAAIIHLVSPTPIRFAWNTHFPGNLRAVNNNFLDTYQLKIQNALLDATVCGLQCEPDGRIRASLAYSHAEGEREEIVYDHVINCAGFAMDRSIFAPGAEPAFAVDGRLPLLTPEFESATVPGLYFAGALTQSLDYKRSNSAFVHGFRYNARVLARLIEKRLYGASLPSTGIPRDADRIARRILERVNRSSAHWQQFGFIGDVFVVTPSEVRHYEDLPVEYVHRSSLGRHDLYMVVTLEFGTHTGDVFAVPRSPSAGAAHESFFLHPVVRAYSRGLLLQEHHLLENLFGEWTHPRLHLRPLRDFVAAEFVDSVELAHDAPARA